MGRKGWGPLPTSLKVLFVILIFSAFSSLFAIASISHGGYSVLGFQILGMGAVISLIVFNLLGVIVFLIAMWNRLNWAWKYGVAYFAFFIVNGLLGLINLPKKLELLSSQIPEIASGSTQMVYFASVAGILFGTMVNVVFLILIYKKRSYFE